MLSKVIFMIKLILSHAPDLSTSEGRSLDRYRRAALTALANVIARVINIGTALATVPLTLGYLGEDRFGLWMVLTGFLGLLAFTDMGLGIGLQNMLAESHGRDDRFSARGFVSSAMLVMLLMSLLLVGAAFFVLPVIPLDRLVKVGTDLARSELLLTTQVVLITFGVGLPTGLVRRIYSAYQQGYRGALWFALGRIVGLLGVLVCIWLRTGLPTLVLCFMGSPFMCLGVGSIFFFKKYSWLRPSFRAVSRDSTRKVFRIGITAVGAQLAVLILHNGPTLVIANRLGTTAVTPFAITKKLLVVTNILIMTAILPLWPAYSEASARGDWPWVKKTLKRSIKLAMAIQLPMFALMTFSGRWIISVWTQEPSVVPSWSLFMACNVWMTISVWITAISIALNGLNHMIGQATYGVAFALIALVLGYWIAGNGVVSGVIWTVVAAGAVTTAIAMGFEVSWVIRKASRRSKV